MSVTVALQQTVCTDCVAGMLENMAFSCSLKPRCCQGRDAATRRICPASGRLRPPPASSPCRKRGTAAETSRRGGSRQSRGSSGRGLYGLEETKMGPSRGRHDDAGLLRNHVADLLLLEMEKRNRSHFRQSAHNQTAVDHLKHLHQLVTEAVNRNVHRAKQNQPASPIPESEQQ